MKRNTITGRQNAPIILEKVRRRLWCSKISLLTLCLVPDVLSSIDLENVDFHTRDQFVTYEAFHIISHCSLAFFLVSPKT